MANWLPLPDQGAFNSVVESKEEPLPQGAIGQGKNHVVYNSGLDKVEKIPRIQYVGVKRRRENNSTFLAYNSLRKLGVPCAQVIEIPEEIHNGSEEFKAHPNNGWIIKRLFIKAPKEQYKNAQIHYSDRSKQLLKKVEALSAEETHALLSEMPIDKTAKDFLVYAKFFIDKSIEKKFYIIGDFKPDNVMMTADKVIKVVDFAFNTDAFLPEIDPETLQSLLHLGVYKAEKKGDRFEFMHELKHSIKEWSCGNEDIRAFLTAGFPQNVREYLD